MFAYVDILLSSMLLYGSDYIGIVRCLLDKQRIAGSDWFVIVEQ